MNIMTYYIIYMTYEISLALIYNCILNLVNKSGFQVDSQSRLRSWLPPEPFVPLAQLGLAQKWSELSRKSWLESLHLELFPSLKSKRNIRANVLDHEVVRLTAIRPNSLYLADFYCTLQKSSNIIHDLLPVKSTVRVLDTIPPMLLVVNRNFGISPKVICQN